jgi:hypothetical protein
MPLPLYPRGTVPSTGTHCVGLMSPRAGLNSEKETSLALAENRTPILQPSTL